MTVPKTAALLFADIAGSTRLLARLGDRYAMLLADYHRLLGEAIAAAGGETAGTEGDGLFAVFPTARGAVHAAVDSQRRLAGHEWPGGVAVRARMGVHAGDIRTAPTGYVGLAIHVAARVAAAAHGGQVLVTANVAGLAGLALPEGVGFRDVGEHRLKDIDGPERLFQLDIQGMATDFPPPRGAAARRHNLPGQLSSFVGREIEAAEVDALLDRSRLVTLAGAGGAGRTRLALNAARNRLDRYRDGVWMADLSALEVGGRLAAALARAVGVAEPRAGRVLDDLIARLQGAQLLLLVDNCEHVLAEAAPVLEEILGST